MKTMSFGEAIRSFFSQYATFTGRARRSEYWWVALFCFIVTCALYLFGDAGDTLVALFSIAILVPSLALAWRRMHDIGKSGWYYLVGLIPLVGWIFILVWFLREGDHGTNQYGPDPKE